MRTVLPLLLALSVPAFAAAEESVVPLKPFRPQSANSPAPTRNTHTVVAGETVYSIARKHGRDPKLILWLNRIEESAVLPVGKVLFVGDAAPRVAAE